jgi:hypothetical protein
MVRASVKQLALGPWLAIGSLVEGEPYCLVSILDNPKILRGGLQLSDLELRNVKTFIEMNKRPLLDFWNGVHCDIQDPIVAYLPEEYCLPDFDDSIIV